MNGTEYVPLKLHQLMFSKSNAKAYAIQLELHKALLSDIRRERSDDTTVRQAAKNVTVRHIKYFRMSTPRGEFLQ